MKKLVEWLVKATGLKTWAVVAILIASLMACGAFGALCWKVNGWRADSAKLTELKGQVDQYLADKKKYEDLAKKYQGQLQAARQQYRKLNERLDDAFKKANLGADDSCRWPADWVPVVNKTLAGTAGAGTD